MLISTDRMHLVAFDSNVILLSFSRFSSLTLIELPVSTKICIGLSFSFILIFWRDVTEFTFDKPNK